jgi:hypothetical protein
MAGRGVCVITPAGVYVPQAAIASERHAIIQRARLRRLQAFHDQLRDAGFLAAQETLPRRLPAALARPVNRALSDYMLRSCDRLVRIAGAVTDGYVLLGLCAENCRDLDLDRAVDGLAALTPCRASRLARRLDVAEETVRRRLHALGARGRVRLMGKAWLVVSPGPQALAQLVADNEADLLRLFGRLREVVRPV